MPLEIDSTQLFPLVKIDYSHVIYEGDTGFHIQQANLENLAIKAQGRISVPMFEDVTLTFALPEKDRFRLLLEKDRLGLVEWTDMQLIHHSFRNLLQQFGEKIEILGSEDAAMRIKVGNDMEASFLLLGNLWQNLAQSYGENLYAAIPRQDLLLIAAADNRSGILQLQKAVKAIFQTPDAGPFLSKAIYQRWDGEWKIIASAF